MKQQCNCPVPVEFRRVLRARMAGYLEGCGPGPVLNPHLYPSQEHCAWTDGFNHGRSACNALAIDSTVSGNLIQTGAIPPPQSTCP